MIFRKVALERLSSPEQLDQLVQVTDPRGWLALAGLGALLLAAIGWGIWGSIPTEAQGQGLLLRQGGVSALESTGTGQVQEILVGVGDEIEKDQPVARVRQDALGRQIEDNNSKLRFLRGEYDRAVVSNAEQKRLRARDLAQQRANLERTIEAADKDVKLLQDRVEAERALLNDGLITKQAFVAIQQTLNAKREELAGHRLELDGLDLKRMEADRQLEQELEARQAAIRDLDLATREQKAQLAENGTIVSQHAGRVLEVFVDRGSVVSPGTQLLNLEIQSEDLLAVLFVPASVGKKVQTTMPVRIAPSTVKREEFGTLLGRVVRVAPFPATVRGMTRQLSNDTLVTKLMAEGPLIEVDVSLDRDPRTPTGYKWSSSRGPSLQISSGTLAAGDIVIRTDPPMSLVIPRLRERLGL